MVYKRARLFDALALLVAIIVIALDQVTKALVVANLSPPESRAALPVVGDYLSIYYIQNSGAAFSMFSNNAVLVVLIAAALCVIVYLYARMLNSGPMGYKLIFGMIIGGAVSNLIDRAMHGGYVVDFIFFQIPQIGYRFAVFNLADASISVGVIILLLFVLTGGLRKTRETVEQETPEKDDSAASQQEDMPESGSLQSTRQDV